MRAGPAVRRWWVAIGCAAAVVVLTLLVAVRWSPLQALDRRVVETAHRQVIAHSDLLASSRGVTHLGDPLVVTVLSLALAAWLWLRGRRRMALAVVVVRAIAMTSSSALKHAVDRPRPAFHDAVAHAAGPAFPSGHALGSAALWLTVAWLVRDRMGRGPALALAVLVPLLVGASRILLGVHWPSDVVAGLALGWCVAVVTLHLIPPRPQRVP